MVATACVAALAALAACGGDTSGRRVGAPAGGTAPDSVTIRTGAPTVPGNGSPVWGFTRLETPSPPLGAPQTAPADGTAGSWQRGDGASAAAPVTTV
jgi:hypothetical protein